MRCCRLCICRHLDRRLPGGVAGQGCAQAVVRSDRPADGRMAKRVRALAEARFVGATCVHPLSKPFFAVRTLSLGKQLMFNLLYA